MPSVLPLLFLIVFSFVLRTAALVSINGLGRRIQPFEVPIQRRKPMDRRMRRVRRGTLSGSTGLGNNHDLLYSVPVELGSITTALHLDTGSSDLWVISEKCTAGTCASATSATRYPSSILNSTGVDVIMHYGDSTTGTQASGVIGYETAVIANIAIEGQTFASIDATDNPTVKYETAGLMGLGFPTGSEIQEALVIAKTGQITTTDSFLENTYADGPLLARIAMSGALEMPMFSVSLQRSTIDIGGTGMLTVGKLPDGVDNSSLTWVPVRLYSYNEGGLRAPTFAPDEVYPFRWELDIDGVFLDGVRVPDSAIPANGGPNVDSRRVSGLIDTGNSLLRGPSDVVDRILSTVSSVYNPSDGSPIAIVPCARPHNMAFQIGGKMFPIDPRDFIGQNQVGDATNCVADNLVATDPPNIGALYRWSLGDPFFKSNLVAFHYGNLTHPSVDPPRIGILSIVPANADAELADAVNDAKANNGNFDATIELAPTASAASAGQITVDVQSQDWEEPETIGFTTPTTTSTPEPDPTPSPDDASNASSDPDDSNTENHALSIQPFFGFGSVAVLWAIVSLIEFGF